MVRFTAHHVDTHVALKFWDESPHATIWTHPEVLGRLAPSVDWWLVTKGDEPACIWPITTLEDGSHAPPPNSYYVGPMWSSTMADRPAHRWLADDLGVMETFFARFEDEYGAFRASLPPGNVEVRSFDWWHYHEPDRGRFDIRPRYSARITELRSRSESDLTSAFRQLRRRELKRAVAGAGPRRLEIGSSGPVVDLYRATFARQGQDVDERTVASITSLLDLVADGFGSVVAFGPSSSDVRSVILVLRGKGVANVVLNLIDDEFRASGLATHAMTEAVMESRRSGDDIFDFNGANSPARGDDKHSYGASPLLYFDVSFPR